MGEGSNFYYQHDARLHDNDTRITIFDNAGVEGSPAEPEARGIELQLDMQNMTANLVRAYPAPFGNISGSQGSFQLLENGNFLAGWGVRPDSGWHRSDAKLNMARPTVRTLLY